MRFRNTVKLLSIGVITLVMAGCGGGSKNNNNAGNTPAPPTTVNLVGTWEDTAVTSGSICDGLVAKYIAVNEPYNGDPDVMGTITAEGTIFDVDGAGNCYLAPLNKVDATAAGTPSNMTKDQYTEWSKQRLAGIGTIDSFDVINYNHNIISVQINYTTGVVMYIDAVRQ